MLILTGVLTYLVLLVIVRQLHPQGILFYQGIALSILVPMTQGIIIHVRRHTHLVTRLKDLAITFLLSYTFVATFPTNADRSFSIRMLQRIEEAPQGLTREGIGRLYTVDFVELGGLDKRLIEQQVSGTIREQAGKYVLTRRGKAINTVSRLTCAVFVCERPRQYTSPQGKCDTRQSGRSACQ